MATSSAVKNRYNRKAYRQWNSRIKPDLFDRLEDYCKKNQLSRAEFLAKSIETLEKEAES